MNRTTFAMTSTAVAAVVLSLSPARGAEPTMADLQRQIEQLQAQVAELQARQQHTVDTAHVDAVVREAIEDAERRSQLLQIHGFTAGYHTGRFVLQSEDGAFTLRPALQLQLRHVTNVSEQAGGGDDYDVEHGFELRRTKFQVDGNAFGKNLSYFFLWNSDRNSGNLGLEHAWVKYMTTQHLGFRAGQIGNPTFHEQAVSSKKQLAVERSLTNALVTGTNEGQTQAVTIILTRGPWLGEFGYGDGFTSANSNWASDATGWGTFGRVEYMFFGDIATYQDFSPQGDKIPLFTLGAGYDVTEDADSIDYRHTLDAQYENPNGLALFGAYYGNYIDDADGDETYNWGALAQAGYMLNEKWEVFGRYDFTLFDDDQTIPGSGADDFFQEYTIGVNYYLRGHSAKFTVDLNYLPEGSPTAQTGMGYIRSGEDQFVVRSQFQLLI